MKIRVTCPACHDTLEVDDQHVGKEVECGSCLQPFTVEDPAAKKPKKYKMRRDDDDEDKGATPAKKPAWSKGRSKRRDDEDDRDDDEEEDRPRRRRRRDYDDEDYQPRKSRVAYIILGIFLGSLGIHNFYAGRTSTGLTQLLITVVASPVLFCAGFFLLLGIGAILGWVPWFAVWVWVLVELVTVDRDGNGRRME